MIVASVLLAASLALPWWSETEVFGPDTWVQELSPLTGVTARCSPSCGALDEGPPTGPLQGTYTFSAVGLSDTGLVYAGALGLIVVGLAASVAGLVAMWSERDRSPSSRWERVRAVSLRVALLTVGAGTALLPVLQPAALRADTIGKLSSGSAWVASPSPETSFLGACVRGQFHGVCASGGSASWGPGAGWVLLLVATALLLVVAVREASRWASSRPPPPADR